MAYTNSISVNIKVDTAEAARVIGCLRSGVCGTDDWGAEVLRLRTALVRWAWANQNTDPATQKLESIIPGGMWGIDPSSGSTA